MGRNVHFLGLEITPREVLVSLLRRDGVVVASARRELLPEGEDEAFCRYKPTAWARFVAATAREVVETSGVPTTRIWGYAPVAPPGWICLDVEWRPMTDLYISKEEEPADLADRIADFLKDPRRAARVGLVAAPKDFLRFHWSKVIATDVTDAASFGLLGSSSTEWDPDRVFEKELETEWFPPVFPSSFACGRVGEGGVEALGLSGSAWVAVGSTSATARLAACGSVGGRTLYLLAHRPGRAYWYEQADALAEPRVKSAPLDALPPELADPGVPVVVDWLEGEDPKELIAWAKQTGRRVYRAPFAGGLSPGAAVLAALASGAYASRESFYRRFPQPEPLQDAFNEETPGS